MILSQRNFKKKLHYIKYTYNTVITLNGSFDLFHMGHLHIIKEAKKQGDILIVGLNSDKSVKLYKGKNRPIIPEWERAEILDAIKYVDYVILFDEPEIGCPLINLVKPNAHVNGSDWGKSCIEAPLIKKLGGRLHIVERYSGSSTSDIINKIRRF